MKQNDDGGPAFPVKGDPGDYYTGGMSLRDYFAGQALAGLGDLPRQGETQTALSLYKSRAALAYNIADAMLAARSAPQGDV